MGSGADNIGNACVVCPRCARNWNQYSEQAASIYKVGHCIVCAVEIEKGATKEKPMFRELLPGGRIDIGSIISQQDAKKLSHAHWQYIESVLKQHGESEDVIAKCGHHYMAAFEHGWKHAKEEA